MLQGTGNSCKHKSPQSARFGTGKRPTAMGIANSVAEHTFFTQAKLTTPRELEAKHVSIHRNLPVEKFLENKFCLGVREQHKEYVKRQFRHPLDVGISLGTISIISVEVPSRPTI